MANPGNNHLVVGMVAEPDINRRGRLKTAAQAIPSFKRIDQVSTLNEALAKLNNDKHVDVIFLSSEFKESDIANFVSQCAQQFASEDYAYVVILKQVDDQSALARILLTGVHCFLCEPYSVDRLQEITELVTKVKGEGAAKRRKAATAMLIQTLMREFDKLSLYISRGLNVDRAKRRFAETCASLKKFDDESLKVYTDLASEMFETAAPSGPGNYGGVSKRIKEKMDKKLLEEFEKEEAAAGAVPNTQPPK